MGKDDERSVPTRRRERLLQLGMAASGLAWRGVKTGLSKLVGKERAPAWLDADAAAILVKRLGHLRGAAMKLGQMLSMEGDTLFPTEFTDALAALRNQSWRMPSEQVQQVLGTAYGDDWAKVFKSFDASPIAAASIGQVHRAVTREGLEVAVKLQYPGVRDSIDSDIDNLQSLLHMANLMPGHIEVGAIASELKAQLHEEADYMREAASLRRYGDLLNEASALRHSDGRAWFRVPAPIEALCRDNVLVMSFESGEPLLKDKDSVRLAQSTRDAIGVRMLYLLFAELLQFKWMQTDPNFANYLYDQGPDQIVLLDFGATREVGDRFIQGYRGLLTSAWHQERSGVADSLLQLGFVAEDTPTETSDALTDFVWLTLEPIRTPGLFHFGHSGLGDRIRKHMLPMASHKQHLPSPPPQAIFFQRKLAGIFLMLRRLQAVIDVRGTVERCVI